jgi:hypothetical protein
MLAWIKRGALICGLFVAVWILMLVYWSSTNRMPTSTDILLYLVLLPVVFLLAIWIVRKVRSAIAAGVAAKATATAAAGSAAGLPKAGESNDSGAAERAWTLAIVACALRSPHGAGAAALSAALASKEARLQLDSELTDADGFPVRSGRIAEADDSMADGIDATPIAIWIGAGGAPQPAWTPEQSRALALAGEVLTELAGQLQLHPELTSYLNAKTGFAARDAIPLPSLQLIPLLPAHWPQDVRKHAADWFVHLVTQQGWPAEKILPVAAATADHADALSDSFAPFKLIDDLSLRTHRQTQPASPCLALLVACESFIGSASVTAWDQAGQLLKGKGNAGQTPGEGAVAFLIADTRQAALMQADPASTLHRAALGRRDKSADASGRIDGAFLTGLAQNALGNAAVTADDITLLIADSDHRSSRTAELMGVGYAVLPEIDLGSQCLKVAADCGSAGAVSCLTALALAHHAAATAEQGKAVLCVSNNDAFERAAVVLSPYINTAFESEPASPPAPATSSQPG